MGHAFFRDFDILILGELFTEFASPGSLAESETFTQNMGGSDIYTAVAAARQGAKVGLLSALARDPFAKRIREQLNEEQINTDYVISTGGYNGLYFVNDESNDKREYLYNRPGTALLGFTAQQIDDSLIASTKIIYSSSEFQSLSKGCRQAVFKAFYSAHTNDSMVAYDPNLRLHRQSIEETQESLWSILPFVDVMLPSAPGETKALFGYERPVDVIGFLRDRGVHVVAVKNGANGCMIGYDGQLETFEAPALPDAVVSETLIGSVFNGIFLHAIAAGCDPFTAGRMAVDLAAQKVRLGMGYHTIPRL